MCVRVVCFEVSDWICCFTILFTLLQLLFHNFMIVVGLLRTEQIESHEL